MFIILCFVFYPQFVGTPHPSRADLVKKLKAEAATVEINLDVSNEKIFSNIFDCVSHLSEIMNIFIQCINSFYSVLQPARECQGTLLPNMMAWRRSWFPLCGLSSVEAP